MDKPIYKGFYNIVKNEAAKEATIYIYGVIGGFNWDSFTFENTADKFVSDFKQIEATADTIHIKINSPGGNVHDGLPIFNVINNSEKTVYTYVDGIAYSMAALIALAGDKVYGYNNSLFMVHNASTIVFGNAQDLQNEVEVLSKYDEALGTIIEDKLNISTEDVATKFLNFKDNFFTAKEAKTEGFFDEIISNAKASKVPDNVLNMSQKELLDYYAQLNFEEKKPNPHKDNKPRKTKAMSKAYPSIEAALNKQFAEGEAANGILLAEDEADIVENHIKDLSTQITAANDARTVAETALTDANAVNDSIVAQVNQALNLEGDAAVTTVVDAVEALNAHIAELGKQPGATHTNIADDDQADANKHPYIDFNTPFYKKTKQLLN